MRLSLFSSKQCIIKQLLDSVFVISGIINVSVMHQSIETPALWVPGKGGGFDIDPSQKASISLPPEAIV